MTLDRNALPAESIRAFARAILHGDDVHKDWLFEAAEKFIAGHPMPEARSRAALPEPVPAEVEGLRRELTAEKAERVYAAKLMLKFRDTLSNIRDAIEDEGDRRYFGSTNHADQLLEIIEAVEELEWDRITKATKGRDLYAEMSALNANIRALAAENGMLESELDEAVNWTATVEAYNMDEFDDLAELWLALPAIQRTINAVTSVFTKWASDEIMARFRGHQLSMFHIAFAEGCLAGAKAADARRALAEDNGKALEPDVAIARAASVICEVGALCGWPGPDCKSTEAAEALFNAGLLNARRARSLAEGEG